jgi:hypothetical protein
MSNDCFITVDDERAVEFKQVFGTPTVPIRSPTTMQAEVAAGGLRDVYFLDLDGLTLQQHNDLIAHVARACNTTVSEALLNIRRNGFPILADGTTLIMRHPLWPLD